MRIDFCRITRTAVAISTALLLLAVPRASAAVLDEPQQPPGTSGDTPLTARGQQIYQERCISCHGVNGQGTPQAPAPIFGDRSLADLADLITRTMPEGSPEDCVGDDAVAVAEWMQAAFYSPEAQARLNPPRLELTRLTVQQYRNAAADLGVEFRWRQAIDAERGLHAEYFAGRGLRRDKRVFQRQDPVVDFQFGAFSPDGEKIEEEAFAISWDGSVLARESGWYEFVVRTENAARLYVNGRSTPLIDAWVRSGADTEFRGSRYLLAGRLYPLRLEWFKFREPTASVQLYWKPPGGVDELLPARHLIPKNSPEVLVVETPFPPDDRSAGYERGISVSKEWDEAATGAAIEVADRVLAGLKDFLKLRDGEDSAKRMREFAGQFAERAFRRPLTEELRQRHVDEQFAAAKSPEDGLRRSLLVTLLSPRFLYREVEGLDDQYDRASRLSFAVVNSIPDAALREAAAAGQLQTEQQLREQAWRLVNDPRAKSRLLEFLRSWLNLERLQDLDKNDEHYPGFTPQLASDLRTSLELTLAEIVNSEQADFRSLLLADRTWMNRRMAEFYGVSWPESGSDFVPLSFEPERRAGVISHPLLLSGLAYMDTSSPIHRGVFLTRAVLGRGIKPPPVAVAPTAPELAPELTTRERVAVQTSPELCASCHRMINSAGFALENFDAVGRFRDRERDRAIDATGQYEQRNGQLVRFNGARELAGFLARSEETRRSFVRQLFHHQVQQPILAYGPETIQRLSDLLEQGDFNIRRLQVEIAVISALRGWSTKSEQTVADRSETR